MEGRPYQTLRPSLTHQRSTNKIDVATYREERRRIDHTETTNAVKPVLSLPQQLLSSRVENVYGRN
jgi:hypothetical protein